MTSSRGPDNIDAAQRGTFIANREKDELTMALGNPEHPGRTRGTPGSIPWKVGFPDAGGYKTHERRKKLEQDQLQALHERVMGLEEREAADRSKRPVEASPEATLPRESWIRGCPDGRTMTFGRTPGL